MAAVLLSVVTLTTLTFGQQSGTFVSTTEGVKVDVLVTDGRRPVSGLSASDFEIKDDGVVQHATLIANEAVPVDVVLVLDESDSLAPAAFQQLKQIADQLGTTSRAIDRVGLITFTHVVHLRQPLTHDVNRLHSALAVQAPSDSGGTALFDATISAITTSEIGTRRTLIVILSDGEDTASWLAPESVIAAAIRSDVVAYSVLTERSGPIIEDTRPGAHFPRELSEATGGRVLKGPAATVAERFSEVVKEFQNRYVLTFVPSGPPKPGWHILEVRVANKTVTARRAYISISK